MTRHRPSAPSLVQWSYGFIAVVGVPALAVSAYYLWDLALAVKMRDGLAWTLPVALDVGGIGATIVWVNGTGRARRTGRSIALINLAGTLAGNILAHLIDIGVMHVSPWLVIGIATVYPAEVWAMAHLALLQRAEQRDLDAAHDHLAGAAVVRERAQHQLVEADRDLDAARAAARRTVEFAGATSQLCTAVEVRGEAERQRDAARQARDVAEQDRDAAARARRAAEQQTVRRQRATDDATTRATQPATNGAAPAVGSREQRRVWVRHQLDQGRDVQGADVDREFGPPRNGAAVVKEVRAERSSDAEPPATSGGEPR